MNKVASRGGIIILLVLVLVAGLVFFVFEYTTKASQWVITQGSPHVYQPKQEALVRGVVTDRSGKLLMNMAGKRSYAEDSQLRTAVVHWTGDRQGNISTPMLAHYADTMITYDNFNGTYTYGDAPGGVVQLTLSSDVQMAALSALGDYTGTVGVYNYKTGELICAVSTPAFDPENPQPVVEGMYLNRFIQSQFVPGSVFKIVTLAAALETIPDIMEQTFSCDGTYEMGKDTVTCDGNHGTQTLKQAFRNSCNCAFAQISEQLGKKTLTDYVTQFGVVDAIEFDGITTRKGNFELKDASVFSVAWSSIGQYTDMINPCAYMSFVGAIAAGGVKAVPHIVGKASGEESSYTADMKYGERIMSESTAEIIQKFLEFNVYDKYGSENFPGLTVGAKTGTAEVGGGKKPNAVLTGFVQDEKYPLAFIAIVEDGGYGREICIPIVSKVLDACKKALDSE